MTDRRSFLRTLAAGGAALALSPFDLFAGRKHVLAPYFGVHGFIESHPDAVFILRTNVDVKTNATAVLQSGLAFGSSVFVPLQSPGIPVTHRVAIKPNIVMMPVKDEKYMGIVTDPYFVEGVIQSLKSLGIAANQFYLREVNDPHQFANSGYSQMAERTGADLRDLDDPVGVIAESDLQWVDVPNGKWFKKIPFLWPVNAPDTWLLNIAKLKTHVMGMSLCAKNIQGAVAIPYVAHCTKYGSTWNISPDHIQPNANTEIWDDYQRHLAAGIPRWDRPGEEGGIWQEIWAARCVDNNSVTHPGLHVIEGVYGREGPFLDGPGPDGKGIDHMTNVIIFGKNPFHVDNIGLWIAGHEPGNFGLLHIAIERGQASVLNPHDIPLYEWFPDGTCVARAPESFTRASLRTNYLRRDYNGQSEDVWHLVNEPYSYSKVLNRQIAVNSGWNMVSVPVVASNMAVTSVLPGASSEVFAFNGSYVPVTSLDAGKGYWAKFPSPKACPVSGAQVADRTIAVNAGWNMIGGFETDTGVAEITTVPSGILASSFFGFNQGYAEATTLQSGSAYWIHVTASGELRLPAGPPKSSAHACITDPSVVHLDIRDAAGGHALLHLAAEHPPALKAALPPVPPQGCFDVRFAGNVSVKGPEAIHDLCLQSAQYPVTVRALNLNGRTLRLRDGAGTQMLNEALDEGVQVIVTRDYGVLQIEEVDLPLSYALNQNYPNPFNPKTVISCQWPVVSNVRLVVYDLLGREVQVLVDDVKEPGSYDFTFDGAGLASGVYIYRLSVSPETRANLIPTKGRDGAAGEYSATRRMILTK